MNMKLSIERAIIAMNDVDNGKCDGPKIKGRQPFNQLNILQNRILSNLNDLTLQKRVQSFDLARIFMALRTTQPYYTSGLRVRARWFQLFVMESFGELSYSAGYRKKHSRLYGFGVGGLLYPAQALPMWQISVQGAKNRFLGFLLLKSDLMLAISTQPSSVTKRNIMDRMEKVVGTAYTPHQCSYGDRKLSSLGGNLQNTFCALFYLFTLN